MCPCGVPGWWSAPRRRRINNSVLWGWCWWQLGLYCVCLCECISFPWIRSVRACGVSGEKKQQRNEAVYIPANALHFACLSVCIWLAPRECVFCVFISTLAHGYCRLHLLLSIPRCQATALYWLRKSCLIYWQARERTLKLCWSRRSIRASHALPLTPSFNTRSHLLPLPLLHQQYPHRNYHCFQKKKHSLSIRLLPRLCFSSRSAVYTPHCCLHTALVIIPLCETMARSVLWVHWERHWLLVRLMRLLPMWMSVANRFRLIQISLRISAICTRNQAHWKVES